MKHVLKLRLHRGPKNFTVEVMELQNIEVENDKFAITLKQTFIGKQNNKMVLGINHGGDLYYIMGNPVELLEFSSNEERDNFKNELVNNIHSMLSNLTGLSEEEIKQKYYKESFYYSNLYFNWDIDISNIQ